MQRRNAVFQFGLQNVKAQCSFPIRNANVKAVFQSGMHNVKAQCSFQIEELHCALTFCIPNWKTALRLHSELENCIAP